MHDDFFRFALEICCFVNAMKSTCQIAETTSQQAQLHCVCDQTSSSIVHQPRSAQISMVKQKYHKLIRENV